MARPNPDLHGNAPDKSDTVLLLIDVINALEFPRARQLLSHALPAAKRIARLKQKAKRAKIPVVYVNDNFGRWRSDFREVVARCLEPERLGSKVAALLEPEEDDYFVLKPKHSGFFSTTLSILLEYLGAKTLILAGFAGNICVLYTAHDAYLRDYRLVVPSDCVASNTAQENSFALTHMRRLLKASTKPSSRIRLTPFSGRSRRSRARG